MFITEERTLPITSDANGFLIPCANGETPNAIATISLQTNEKGEPTAILSFAGHNQACLQLSRDLQTVIAYVIYNPMPDQWLQESVNNLSKAYNLFK